VVDFGRGLRKVAMEEAKPRKLSTGMIAAVAIIVILSGALGYTVVQLTAPEPAGVTYLIGMAIAVTGETYRTDGPIRLDAATLAVDQMNARLESAGSRIRFRWINEDTAGTTAGAQSAFTSLAGAGARVVVGPLSTGEVNAIRDYVTTNEIVAISPSSTGVSARFADYMFRAAPVDIPQAKALAQLLDTLNFTKVALIAQETDYGRGFAELFQQEFTTNYSGEVLREMYNPAAPTLGPEVINLRQNVNTLGVDPATAVVVVSFEEGQDIFEEAAVDPNDVLRDVRWFGSESTRRSAWLNRSGIPAVVDFLIDVRFSGFFASPADQPVKVAFDTAYTAKYPGRDPSASPYAYFSYDSAMLAMEAVLAAGEYDGEKIAKVLPWVAQHFFGTTGHKILNEFGDAVGADYHAWRIATNTPERAKFEEWAVWAWQTEELTIFA
jgi:branched-chain amino acid transport system substrate-binding protein